MVGRVECEREGRCGVAKHEGEGRGAESWGQDRDSYLIPGFIIVPAAASAGEVGSWEQMVQEQQPVLQGWLQQPLYKMLDLPMGDRAPKAGF